ncbi:MAG: ABC transporter permease, partial [Acidiphilium sp. 21-68-69]
MTPIDLTPADLLIAASLVLVDALASVLLGLRLHRQLLVAAARCAVQLLLIGFLLRFVFAAEAPLLTLGIILLMVAIAGREVAARPERRLVRYGNQIAGLSAVALATFITAIFALTRERAAIEAQLALGARFRDAMRPLIREAVRRGMLPIVNTMSAAGLVTLPGIMTGQILAGLSPVSAVKYQIMLMFL